MTAASKKSYTNSSIKEPISTFTAKPSKSQKLEPTYKSPLKLTQILATTKIT